jgi:hypothetical protein
VDGAVRQRLRERIVDEPVLLDEREPGEARARDGDLKVVASARAILDRELGRVREGDPKELLEPVGHERDASTGSVGAMSAFGLVARALASAAFAAAAFAFTLPMSALYAGERVGTATGLELVRGEPVLTGARLRGEERGEVASRFRQARIPAAVALAAAGAGLVLALFAPAGALAVGLVGLGGLAGVFAVTASPFVAVATDRRYGFWAATLAVGAAVIGSLLAVLARRRR